MVNSHFLLRVFFVTVMGSFLGGCYLLNNYVTLNELSFEQDKDVWVASEVVIAKSFSAYKDGKSCSGSSHLKGSLASTGLSELGKVSNASASVTTALTNDAKSTYPKKSVKCVSGFGALLSSVQTVGTQFSNESAKKIFDAIKSSTDKPLLIVRAHAVVNETYMCSIKEGNVHYDGHPDMKEACKSGAMSNTPPSLVVWLEVLNYENGAVEQAYVSKPLSEMFDLSKTPSEQVKDATAKLVGNFVTNIVELKKVS